MKKTSILILLVLVTQLIYGQEKFWVIFKDKSGTNFNPYEYFDQKAIDRRINSGIPICDSTDFPVNEQYINQVSEMVEEVTTTTRWFNGVAVWATAEQIDEVKKLKCVSYTQKIYLQTCIASIEYDSSLSSYDADLLINQLKVMEGSKFKEAGLDGTGMRIAIFDTGFPDVDIVPVFEHIRADNRIIKTWDFTTKNENVYHANHHGTMVMSCIAGMLGNKQIGLATGAEFLLARTEVAAEPFSEEENWLAAVEWADKNGADLVNSSLGYTKPRYFPHQMDGKHTFVVRAADLAAEKGILVLNAMGNDGDANWKFVGTPADAENILSIGGTNPSTGYHTSFSSFGPTADKRLKPNVVAFGHAIVATEDGLEQSQGTSFSTPLVTGFAACAWQSKRSLTNMEMKSEIEHSGNLFPYFDYAHGYGVPQASYFTNEKQTDIDSTFSFDIDNGYLIVNVKETYIDEAMESRNYLYYHVENMEGYLDKYLLIDVYQQEAHKIELNTLDKGSIIRVHYKGYTQEYTVN